MHKKIDIFNIKYITGEDSEITLTKNEIKDIMKVIKSLENKGILLKGTTKNVVNQKGGLLGILIRGGLPLMKNVLTPPAKSVLLPLEVTVAASALDAAIQKEICGLRTTAPIISNEEMDEILKIIKSHKELGLLMKGICETIENEAEEQKGRFLGMLLGTSDDSLLGNILSDKGIIRAGEGAQQRVGDEIHLELVRIFNVASSFDKF